MTSDNAEVLRFRLQRHWQFCFGAVVVIGVAVVVIASVAPMVTTDERSREDAVDGSKVEDIFCSATVSDGEIERILLEEVPFEGATEDWSLLERDIEEEADKL